MLTSQLRLHIMVMGDAICGRLQWGVSTHYKLADNVAICCYVECLFIFFFLWCSDNECLTNLDLIHSCLTQEMLSYNVNFIIFMYSIKISSFTNPSYEIAWLKNVYLTEHSTSENKVVCFVTLFLFFVIT